MEIKNKYKLHIRSFLFGTIISLCFLSISMLMAWTSPTSNPPESNVSAPINISSEGQIKQGGLMLNTAGADVGLVVSHGNVGIGVENPTTKLEVDGNLKTTGALILGDISENIEGAIRWNKLAKEFEGNDGTEWKLLVDNEGSVVYTLVQVTGTSGTVYATFSENATVIECTPVNVTATCPNPRKGWCCYNGNKTTCSATVTGNKIYVVYHCLCYWCLPCGRNCCNPSSLPCASLQADAIVQVRDFSAREIIAGE